VNFPSRFAAFVATLVAFYITWTILIRVALRICGVPVGIWTGPGKGGTTEEVFRKLGRNKFAFIEGVLLWGWPMFAIFSVSRYITHKYVGAQSFGRILWLHSDWLCRLVGHWIFPRPKSLE
jgi:hypothetical protein